jgi:quinoprotein glucose dehydrogenase
MIFPGFDGGGEWGGAAFDPTSGTLFVNANEMPWILTMVDVKERQKTRLSVGARVYAVNCGVCHGENGEGDQQNTYPPVSDLGDRYSRDQMKQIVEQGKGVMPGFAFLPESEKQALVEFLFGGFRPESGDLEEVEFSAQIPYTHTGYNRFLDQNGYPAVKPPWGTLNAIDLNSGEIKWQVPLGEFEELTAQGVPPTGTENYGGPVVTAGGLVFIGASKDEKFRAFNSETGELIWETGLPAGGYATPATYEVGGRQYVVIAAGGGKMGTKSGDSYIAYALP